MKIAVQTKEVREAILDATDNLLARYGYKKMTIDDLAQEVGIGKGSIYLHFSSKEEIVLSHIDRIVERLKIELEKIVRKNISLEEKLKRMILMRVMFRFDSVQHYTQSLNDLLAALRPKFLARRKSYFNEEANIFAAVIEQGQKEKVFRNENALEIAETFLLATNSLLPYSLSTKELGERNEIEKKTKRLANLLVQGILHS
ncbi:MAG: TetR/AcrR family transcriptional regulator [Pyrinomonadaceae bacterium]|nr:TetR/AcrR family transcriptional regulator [Pyrinomonadaceae bacterium]